MKYQALSSDRFSRISRPRPGSALLLVVVLVLLLALMGTTFLFVMRAARVQAGGPGSGNLMQGTWPTVSQSDLNNAITTAENTVVTALTDGVRPGGFYLRPANVESAYTHPAATTGTLYLSDRFPVTEADRTGGDSGSILWRFITKLPGYPAPDSRSDLYASQFRVTYPTSGTWTNDAGGTAYPNWAMLALSGRTRFFPAITPTLAQAKITANATGRTLAGDADGDGIVDCRLYRDTTTVVAPGYDFWTGVRIVDNNAAVNVNTAWRSTADRDFTNPIIDTPATDPLTGYLGTFRSNIGLYEMLVGSIPDKTDVAKVADADADLAALDKFRFSNAFAGLKDVIDETGTKLAGVEYLTMADSLEHGLVRRLDKTTTPGFYNTSTRFSKFDEVTHDQLVSRFSLVNPNFSNTKLTANLFQTDLTYAPNTWRGNVVQQFQFYGANQSDYWYHTTLSTDSATGTPRENFLGYPGKSANYPNAFDLTKVLKTIRPHLVGENGVTVSAPFVAAPAAGLVATSTTPTDWGSPNFMMADYAATETPRKAWANGAPFGELWRAYYSLFTATVVNPVQTTNFNAGGNVTGFGLPTWNFNKQILLRAAIASVNTLQARLPAADPALVQKVTIGGTDINVFGAKRQPFITEVMVETGRKTPTAIYDVVLNPIEVKWVAIELHNPYNIDISLAQEQLFFVSGGVTWVLGVDLAAQGTIPARGFKTIVAKRTGYVDTGSPVNAMAAIANPGNDAIINNFPITGVGGASLRLVAWDVKTPATALGYDMIPQDEVGDLGSLPMGGVGKPERFRYARPTLTASGSRFNCVYNATAAFDKSTDTAATAPAVWDIALTGTLNAENPGVANTKDDLVIQVGNYSTFKPGSIAGSAFPFLGLARDGDLLSVAFIGNYALIPNPAAMPPQTPYTCSVTKDAFYAEDLDATDDAYEAVGRFAPLAALNVVPAPAAAPPRYDWAARLFDFVTTTQHPGSESSPDSPPELIPPVLGKMPLTYVGRSIQGKLNINTASWQALAALPLVPVNPLVPASSTPALAASQTVKLAKAIVKFRDIDAGAGVPHLAFKSIFELNLVPEFAWRTAGVNAATDLTTADLNIAGVVGTGVGDLSPLDNAIGDFEQRLLGLTRISNLITTRSDSFTVYIVVQAWRHNSAPDNIAAGFPPLMVAEKRVAFVMDRTGLTQDPVTIIDPRQLANQP